MYDSVARFKLITVDGNSKEKSRVYTEIKSVGIEDNKDRKAIGPDNTLVEA